MPNSDSSNVYESKLGLEGGQIIKATKSGNRSGKTNTIKTGNDLRTK